MKFEDAHYPTPKCKHGTETIPLWSCDHSLQGLFQSEELDHPCLDGRSKEKDIRNLTKFYPEYLPLFYKWDKIRMYRAGKASMVEKDEDGKSVHAQLMNERSWELNREARIQGCVKAGLKSGPINGPALYQNSKGIWDPEYDYVRKEWSSNAGKIGGAVTVEKKVGLHDPKYKEQFRQQSIENGSKTSAQVWECLVTGHTAPPGPLSNYQKGKGINYKDKSLRRRLS